ncbi:MAG: RNA methyltransferase [Muribaculaceae bacterium]|nr:RNA methyltransferase [Muribaculaceae bacterium]
MEKVFSMVAKTFQGLEDVLRDELISLGAENVEIGRRMVSFEGDLELMYKANLCCRTALRILVPIEKFTARDSDELYDIVREIDWSRYMTPKTTFAIEATVNSGVFTHSRFVTYRVKDAIVDHFRDKNGERPSVRVEGADLLFNVHIDEDRVTISLDSSGEPLSKRGYRDEQTEAPINEALAAGIIMKTGWRGDCDFADPMCGSGTFLIEAALIAANINPGIYRKGFAFEKWPDFDKELFEELYNDDSAECEFKYKIYGGDIDPEAVMIARRNIKSAQVDDMIEITCKPFSEWTENSEEGVLVTNPPYGRRLKPDDIEELYRGIGTTLKRNFAGWHAWIIGLDSPDFDNIGLKPSMKIPLLNGSLECMLREYVLFSGSYSDFRQDGGHVKNFSFGDSDEDGASKGPRKMKRLSDDEWKRETRKFGQHDHKQSRKSDRRDDFRGNKSDRRDDFRGGDRDNFRSNRPERRDDFRGPGRDANRPARKEDFRGAKRDDRRPARPGAPKFRRDAKEVPFQGPRIPEENTQVINPVRFRKRKEK